MSQGERVKEVRKKLGLTMEKFGEHLGIKKGAISLIENGKNNLTDANIKAICREFNVDYIWLTTGEGEMFTNPDDNFIAKIDRIMAGEDDARKNFFKALINANDEDIIALQRIIDLFTSKKERNSEDQKKSTNFYDDIPNTPEEFEKMYLASDKNRQAKADKLADDGGPACTGYAEVTYENQQGVQCDI